MNSCDVYIVAPIVKVIYDDKDFLCSNVLKIHETINKITEKYKSKVDIYSLAKVKISSVPESCKKIEEATCTIIITTSENIHDFMILIGHAISRNKKICILFLDNLDNRIHDSQAKIIADIYENVYVDCINPLLNDFERLERFILSAIIYNPNSLVTSE